MSAYADTSFLVSLYVLDAHSARAAAHMKAIKLPVLLTPFGELELANALYQRVFRKELASSFWDALIVASALKSAANRILSEDLNAGQTFAGIRIENPIRDHSLAPRS